MNTRSSVCNFAAMLCALAATIAGISLHLIYPTKPGGYSGPDIGPDLRGVVPAFALLIFLTLGLLFSVASILRKERRHQLSMVLLALFICAGIYLAPRL